MSDAIHNNDMLRTLQEEIRNLLQEDEMLFAPPRTLVISEDIGNIEAEINKAIGPLNTGGGVVIVGCPEVNGLDSRRPFLYPVTIRIQCLEQAIVNRSTSGNQVYSERLAEIVHILLRGYEAAENGWSGLTLTEHRSGPAEKFKGYVADIMTFSTVTVFDTVELV